MFVAPSRPLPAPLLRSVLDASETDGWSLPDVSPWFGPFLPAFVRATLRAGGSVRAALAGRRAVALALDDPAERSATVFGGREDAVRALALPLRGRAVFSELPLDGRAETYRIVSVDLDSVPPAVFRHPVRLLDPAEVPGFLAGLRGAAGRPDEPWARQLRGSEESAFGATVDGTPAGLAWAAVAGGHARLHSVWVAPRFRRLGVGSDLVFARLLWARTEGARSAIAEIAAGNAASLATVARAGFAPVGAMYLRAAAG
ncbi:MAG TPA: GNAT family N-acetyltransferase [Thermoplasmata archaeon]|nr:GNAT family N-acetyltransferase [Thermoplasmata archaeon]